MHGTVLLPDNWNGGTFLADFNGWETNVYDEFSWSAMEDTGAVFLPAAGWRDGTELIGDDSYGFYWSSTPKYDYYSYFLCFFDASVGVDSYGLRGCGHSVRLVLDN